jgi:hypothetical protein
VFENFNDHLVLALRNDTLYQGPINTNQIASSQLVSAFASRSQDFEQLSVSYLIDGRQFFNSCQQSYTWRRLQSLTLTSSVLIQTAAQEEIFTLLCDASLTALNMPQLERMILWNGQQEEAGAVIYHSQKRCMQATLTWRGTWDLEFSHDVGESWQKVTPCFLLHVKNERVQGVIKSHGDAIYLLRLPGGVIDPVSLWQIRQEGMMQRMA